MKKRKYIFLPIILIFLLSIIFYLRANSSFPIPAENVNTGEDKNVTVLCAGFDQVGSNTDSIIFLSLNTDEKSLKILQIPRDTYFKKDTTNGKINQLYSRYYQKTKNHAQAMHALKESFEQVFALPVDYYVALNLETVSSAVDKLGGIRVNIPHDLKYEDPEQNLRIDLQKGEQVLDGKKALYFVRYRFGYTDGDLGRVDAQKIFMSSFLDKIKNETKLTTAISVFTECIRKNQTDMPLDRMISLVTNILKDSAEYQVYYMTLPGEATRKNIDSGLSYYVVNRSGAIDLIKNQLYPDLIPADFDGEGILTDNSRLNFRNIYFAPKFEYKVYTDEDIKNLNINIKPE